MHSCTQLHTQIVCINQQLSNESNQKKTSQIHTDRLDILPIVNRRRRVYI